MRIVFRSLRSRGGATRWGHGWAPPNYPIRREENPHPPEVRRYDQSPIASQRGNASGMSGLLRRVKNASKRG